ncbi:hypothetical protein CKO15_05355 [Halorhodospira abdelmalekii]|uniref:PP0621 family protein n=1 Tax=Halorhodospira abdelmalekii TaxID=421629 RepID=UPI001906A6BE|nr:PP0621 family protein [Halorhodospira abdelmalekii]MBK1734723.1 hypothetical protein [Halorhodospira abdelmalekii]
MLSQILLIVLIILAWIGARTVYQWIVHKPRNSPPPAPDSEAAAGGYAEEMVPCAHCGLFLARSKALQRWKRYYCCQDHMRLGPRP